jgi:arylsulfatase A-like enzyme
MKLIVLMTDTFRRDHIGAYGNPWIRTPNLDRLAAQSNVFDHYVTGSFPTLPNRRDMFLGRGPKDGVVNPWTSIKDDETTLADRLGEKKIHSMMINDTANTMVKNMNFMKGFSAWVHNRGQEGDSWWSDASVPLEFPVPPHMIRYPANRWHQILITRAHRRVEEDWFAPKTYKWGCEWIERNWMRDDFMLWLETFDPHEPWDPPQWYIEMYDPGYKGRVFDAPTAGRYRDWGITDREVKHIHARYCGEVTMVDAAVGRVLATLEKVGILDEVAILFLTDHGSYFGQPGDFGMLRKPHYYPTKDPIGVGLAFKKDDVEMFPLLPPLTRIPLFIKLPGQKKGKRFQQIAQPLDIAPTVMELFGLKTPAEFTGQSLLPVIDGTKKKTRPYAFSGASHGLFQAMDANWLYAVFAEGQRAPWLIDLKRPTEAYANVAKKHPDVCRKMHKALAEFDPIVADVPGI